MIEDGQRTYGKVVSNVMRYIFSLRDIHKDDKNYTKANKAIWLAQLLRQAKAYIQNKRKFL